MNLACDKVYDGIHRSQWKERLGDAVNINGPLSAFKTDLKKRGIGKHFRF